MNDVLTELTEAGIRARCSDASFDRGRSYYNSGAVHQRVRHTDGIEARVAGTNLYRITVRSQGSGHLAAFCTCPYDWGGDCKHIVATLLAWIREPESFTSAGDLRQALRSRPKEELVDIVAEICSAYPHLIEELGLLLAPESYDPDDVVAELFADLHPPGDISIDDAVARMEIVARQAERLSNQGHSDVARRTYYTLTRACVDFCETYGAHDIVPPNIPYDFAVAYRELALAQLEERAATIESEVRELLSGDWAPEMFGIDDPLADVWYDLGL